MRRDEVANLRNKAERVDRTKKKQKKRAEVHVYCIALNGATQAADRQLKIPSSPNKRIRGYFLTRCAI